jgi:hypothetical protein
MPAISGDGFGTIADIIKKTRDPMREFPRDFYKSYTDKVKGRSISWAVGTELQKVGLPPTPMYESLRLFFTMEYNWVGFRAPDYLEDLENLHGEIWSPTENERKVLADMFAAIIEKRSLDLTYGTGL